MRGILQCTVGAHILVLGWLQLKILFAKEMDDKVAYHKAYIRDNGDDIPEVRDWTWENINE